MLEQREKVLDKRRREVRRDLSNVRQKKTNEYREKNINSRVAKQAGISGPNILGKKSNPENHCLGPEQMEIP